MRIIPVLDLKHGLVVRGVMGNRSAYRPIETPLAASADPVAVARGLLSLAPFDCLYIADLDAIEGRGADDRSLAALTAAFPQLELWVDRGIRTAEEAQTLLARPRIGAVLGSESVADAGVVGALAGEARAILSLDYRGDRFLGPADLESRAELWPQTVIAMTLAKVGSGAGPDLDRLDAVRRHAAGRAVFAAGGVRDEADLDALRQVGIAGALIASALHDGRLDAAALARLVTDTNDA